MISLIQRVKNAFVIVNNNIIGEINIGLLVLIGVAEGDDEKDVNYIAEKIVNLRIFSDENDKFNYSLLDIKGELLVISQFTLLGETRKGRRPNFSKAAKPDVAELQFNKLIEKLKTFDIYIQTGLFGAHMEVSLCNDGPVTLILDSTISRRGNKI